MQCTWNYQRAIDRCREEATMEGRGQGRMPEWRVFCEFHGTRFPEYRDIPDPELQQERLI